MRYIFGNELAKIVDNKVHVLVGDIGYGVFDNFRKNYPDQFHNVGVIEQSMIGISAGMALKGLKPWVYTITPFLIERAFEQIKLDIDAQNANVKLVGYCDYPDQGVTHDDFCSIPLVKTLSNIKIFEPTDLKSVQESVRLAYEINGPVFIRLKKLK
jgi:transketolase